MDDSWFSLPHFLNYPNSRNYLSFHQILSSFQMNGNWVPYYFVSLHTQLMFYRNLFFMPIVLAVQYLSSFLALWQVFCFHYDWWDAYKFIMTDFLFLPLIFWLWKNYHSFSEPTESDCFHHLILFSIFDVKLAQLYFHQAYFSWVDLIDCSHVDNISNYTKLVWYISVRYDLYLVFLTYSK